MYAKTASRCIIDWELIKWLFGICFHQGRTDSNGGHHDWMNKMGKGFGYYHYHHGNPAHSHTNGVCSYGGSSKQTYIINPYTEKKIAIGQPYLGYYEENSKSIGYYSLNLVSKALTVNDTMGVELALNNTRGIFYACSTGDSSMDKLGEEFTFAYPTLLGLRKDNTLFETNDGKLKLLCHTKKADLDDINCYAYISLDTVKAYMTKENYFTDFYDDGTGVWRFKREVLVKKPSVIIKSHNNGDQLDVGDALRVMATINNVAYATLTISTISTNDEFIESKDGLENQPFVTFSDYILTDKNIGDVIIKVEVGNTQGSDTDIITLNVCKKVTVKVYANDGVDKNRLSNDEQLANAEYIYNYLKQIGWTSEAICGLFGNIQRESHFNPGVWQDKDNITYGYGLVQWTAAGDKFLDWAGFKGVTAATDVNNRASSDAKRLMDDELEYLIYSSLSTTPTSSVHRQWYATTGYGSPLKMTYEQYIVSTSNAGDLALVFHASYERSSDSSAIKQERYDNANRWYDYFTNGTISNDLFK